MLTIQLLTRAWDQLRQKRHDELLRLAPDMTNLDHVYLKMLSETPTEMTIQFSGLESSVNSNSNIPQIKSLLKDWMGRISTNVQIGQSSVNTFVLVISKNSDIIENRDVKIKKPVIQEHKYEHDLSVDRVKIIVKS